MNMNENSNSTTSNIPETSLKEKLDYIQIGKVDKKFRKNPFSKKDIFQGQSYFI